MSKPWDIIQGDVRKVLKTFPSNSFDAMLCDPPYGLSFMGRRWDYSVPSAMVWAEAERVLKPGAHAMIFGGPRTFHRVVVAVEDGGIVPRDLLMWLFGSGFPKSKDIAKGIVDALGRKRKVIANGHRKLRKSSMYADDAGGGFKEDFTITQPASDEAQQWNGQGSAMKPGYEPILLARKLPDGSLAENALEWGVGGLAIDVARVGSENRFNPSASPKGMWSTLDQGETNGRPAVGRWPSNVILSHSARCELVGHRPSKDKAIKTQSTGKVVSKNRAMGGPNYGPAVVGSSDRPDEEIWECTDDCPVWLLDTQVGNRKAMSGDGKHRNGYAGGMFGAVDSMHTARNDDGGPSRFFQVTAQSNEDPTWILDRANATYRAWLSNVGEVGSVNRTFYTAKADRYQRNAGLDEFKAIAEGTDTLRDGHRGTPTKNHHPTIKPIDLIRYLASLILPPPRDTPRRIVVPFSGSGSEIIGCLQAGWDEVVGIERESSYIEIAKARITNGGVFSGLMHRKMRKPRERKDERSTEGSRMTRSTYSVFAHNENGPETRALRDKWKEQAKRRRRDPFP